ncbi:MAG: cytochrome c3 family protein [Myxococcota bacterium]
MLLAILAALSSVCALAGEPGSPAPTTPAATAAPAPKAPAWPAPLDMAGKKATYRASECIECHTGHWVSGHVPPKNLHCETCHVLEAPPSEGVHARFAPATSATCEACHGRTFADRPARHDTAMREGCTTCHDPHDNSRKKAHLTAKVVSTLCVSCHAVDAGQRSVHTAVKRGLCTSCHDPHGSAYAGLLKEEGPNASCDQCHAAQYEEKKVPHLPAATGKCDACHATHASENDGLLKLPAATTCQQCHAPKNTLPQVHSAVVLGRCAKCHDPHGSDFPRKLRADPVSNVCFRCHDDDIKGRKVVHAPVGAGYCTICHDPHQTENPKNLRAPVYTTCTMCHPDKYRPDAKTQHMAVIAYGCTQCHDPHASDNEFRLRKPIIKLCTSCHRGYDDGLHVIQFPAGGGHPVGGRKDPLREGRELVCTSCHDPHGTDNPRMWYRASERLALCVECHRKTLAPASKVGESVYETEAIERLKKKEAEATPTTPSGEEPKP